MSYRKTAHKTKSKTGDDEDFTMALTEEEVESMHFRKNLRYVGWLYHW